MSTAAAYYPKKKLKKNFAASRTARSEMGLMFWIKLDNDLVFSKKNKQKKTCFWREIRIHVQKQQQKHHTHKPTVTEVVRS